jgi:hypothetical protein
MPIQATFLGNFSCAISVNSMTIGPGGPKSTEERFERDLRSCKGSSCVAPVADVWAFGISAMARGFCTNVTNSIRNWPREPVKPCGEIVLIRLWSPAFWRPSSPPTWKWPSRLWTRWKRVPSKSITNGNVRLSGHSMKRTWPGTAHKAVDPDNRLVARSLEREWNEKLAEVEKLEREHTLLPKSAALLLTAEQREQIRRLAHDLPAIWHASTTTFAQRKQLLRWLIKDVTLSKRGNVIDVAIRWQTEALTSLAIPRYKMSWEERQTSPQVVERVRELSPTQTNTQIAALLNEEGERAGMGGSFTVSKIEWIRYAYHIPTECPERPKAAPAGQRGDGRYSARAAADLLNVNVSTIADWCQAGTLESVRSTPLGPRWITLTPEIIAALRKPVRRQWKQRRTRHAG